MNKQKFVKSLSVLVGWRETAFILALVERALPNLRLYLESRGEVSDRQSAGFEDLEALMDRSWEAAIKTPDEDPLIELLDIISGLLLELEEDDNYGARPSCDCCEIWEQALLSCLNQDKKRAAHCSQLSLQTVTDFIEFSEGDALEDDALVKLFEQHPLIEREFSFQAETSDTLRSARHPGDDVLQAIRELARDDGVSSIGISLN